MMFGDILRDLRSESGAAACLEALGDPVLVRRLEIAGAPFGETPAAYITAAAARFANLADDEAWLALMTALERAYEPARAALVAMAEWALTADANEAQAGNCCAAHGGAPHAGPAR